MATREVSVYSTEGGKMAGLSMPGVFSAPIRPDLVNFVHTNMAKNARQAYAVSMAAGHQTSAESWGTGRAVSRIPRVQGGGTQRSGQGAFGNMCRSGRMFAPTKIWRKWHRKINLQQRRYAVTSAIAASACPPLVSARGHKIEQVPEMPLVVGGDNETSIAEVVAKTKDAVKLFQAIGASADAQHAADSKKIRAGKGKMRNRRYTLRKGPLVVYSESEAKIAQAVRNLPGVETCSVDRLNLLQLAPGGHLGRFVIWTKPAFEKLDSLYGSTELKAELKPTFAFPRPLMTNADVAKVINSDEIQSIVRPAIKEQKERRKAPKVNPLKKLDAMLELNPYHEVYRASEMRATAARKAAREAKIAAKRDGTYTKSDEEKAKDKERKERKPASKAFYELASVEGDVMF